MTFCSKCGTKITKTDLFCPNCGNKMGQPKNIQKENSLQKPDKIKKELTMTFLVISGFLLVFSLLTAILSGVISIFFIPILLFSFISILSCATYLIKRIEWLYWTSTAVFSITVLYSIIFFSQIR